MKWVPHSLAALAVVIAVTVYGVARWRAAETQAKFARELADAQHKADALESSLREATARATAEHARLLELDTELGETKTKLTSAESRAVLLARELAERTAGTPSPDVTALQRELETLRATWLPPEKGAAYEARIAELLQQLAGTKDQAAQLAAANAAAADFARDRAAWQQAIAARDTTEQALRTQLATLEQQLGAAKAVPDRSLELASAEETIAALRRQLAQRPVEPISPNVELTNLQHRLAAAVTRGDELAQQVSDAQQALAAAAERERNLTLRLDETSRTLAELRASAPAPETVAQYQSTIASLERQLAALQDRHATTAGDSSAIPVAASRSPSVVNVGPQNAFVILNFGSAHGARPQQTLTICRGPTALARVSISEVREHFSIAQVEPDSLRGTLQKGDTALLAN